MKKKWIPWWIVVVLGLLLFFSRSIYHYTLPKITAEEAGPYQMQYKLPVTQVYLASDAAIPLTVPYAYPHLLHVISLPSTGERIAKGSLLVPMDAHTVEELESWLEVQRSNCSQWKVDYVNACSAQARELRQLANNIRKTEEILAEDCVTLPELESMADMVKYAPRAKKEEYQKKYDDRKAELVVQYQDTLEVYRESEISAQFRDAQLKEGIYQGTQVEIVNNHLQEAEQWLAMLAPEGVLAQEDYVVGECFFNPETPFAAGQTLLQLVPATASATLVLHTDAVQDMGKLADKCQWINSSLRQLPLTILEHQVEDGKLIFSMELPEDDWVNWATWGSTLMLKGPMEPCVIPAAALINEAAVYRVSEWEEPILGKRIMLFQTPVQVAYIYQGKAVISQGLVEGDKVVTSWDRELWDNIEAAWAH